MVCFQIALHALWHHLLHFPAHELTFPDGCEGVVAEGDGDEECKDLLGGPCGPSHEAGDVKQWIQDQEEAVPEAHRTVHGIEVEFEVFTDVVDD